MKSADASLTGRDRESFETKVAALTAKVKEQSIIIAGHAQYRDQLYEQIQKYVEIIDYTMKLLYKFNEFMKAKSDEALAYSRQQLLKVPPEEHHIVEKLNGLYSLNETRLEQLRHAEECQIAEQDSQTSIVSKIQTIAKTVVDNIKVFGINSLQHEKLKFYVAEKISGVQSQQEKMQLDQKYITLQLQKEINEANSTCRSPHQLCDKSGCMTVPSQPTAGNDMWLDIVSKLISYCTTCHGEAMNKGGQDIRSLGSSSFQQAAAVVGEEGYRNGQEWKSVSQREDPFVGGESDVGWQTVVGVEQSNQPIQMSQKLLEEKVFEILDKHFHEQAESALNRAGGGGSQHRPSRVLINKDIATLKSNLHSRITAEISNTPQSNLLNRFPRRLLKVPSQTSSRRSASQSVDPLVDELRNLRENEAGNITRDILMMEDARQQGGKGISIEVRESRDLSPNEIVARLCKSKRSQGNRKIISTSISSEQQIGIESIEPFRVPAAPMKDKKVTEDDNKLKCFNRILEASCNEKHLETGRDIEQRIDLVSRSYGLAKETKLQNIINSQKQAQTQLIQQEFKVEADCETVITPHEVRAVQAERSQSLFQSENFNLHHRTVESKIEDKVDYSTLPAAGSYIEQTSEQRRKTHRHLESARPISDFISSATISWEKAKYSLQAAVVVTESPPSKAGDKIQQHQSKHNTETKHALELMESATSFHSTSRNIQEALEKQDQNCLIQSPEIKSMTRQVEASEQKQRRIPANPTSRLKVVSSEEVKLLVTSQNVANRNFQLQHSTLSVPPSQQAQLSISEQILEEVARLSSVPLMTHDPNSLLLHTSSQVGLTNTQHFLPTPFHFIPQNTSRQKQRQSTDSLERQSIHKQEIFQDNHDDINNSPTHIEESASPAKIPRDSFSSNSVRNAAILQPSTTTSVLPRGKIFRTSDSRSVSPSNIEEMSRSRESVIATSRSPITNRQKIFDSSPLPLRSQIPSSRREFLSISSNGGPQSQATVFCSIQRSQPFTPMTQQINNQQERVTMVDYKLKDRNAFADSMKSHRTYDENHQMSVQSISSSSSAIRATRDNNPAAMVANNHSQQQFLSMSQLSQLTQKRQLSKNSSSSSLTRTTPLMR